MADPKSTLMGLLHYLKPGGLFSLLFYNRDAKLLFSKSGGGNFDYIRAGLVKNGSKN